MAASTTLLSLHRVPRSNALNRITGRPTRCIGPSSGRRSPQPINSPLVGCPCANLCWFGHFTKLLRARHLRFGVTGRRIRVACAKLPLQEISKSCRQAQQGDQCGPSPWPVPFHLPCRTDDHCCRPRIHQFESKTMSPPGLSRRPRQEATEREYRVVRGPRPATIPRKAKWFDAAGNRCRSKRQASAADSKEPRLDSRRSARRLNGTLFSSSWAIVVDAG